MSLAPLLQSAVASWRDGFVIESWRSSWSPEPSYVGLRTPRWKYVSYPDVGETELYDLMQDPFELDSRAHDPTAAPIATGLKAELDDLLAR